MENGALHYQVTVSSLSGPVTSAQIGIGKPGIVGNTASDLTFEGNTAAGMLDAALVNQIYAEGLYINVATAAHPARTTTCDNQIIHISRTSRHQKLA